VEAVEALAAGDAAAGWCLAICATSGSLAAYLPEQAAREVYGDPLGVVGGVFAPSGRAAAAGDSLAVASAFLWDLCFAGDAEASGDGDSDWALIPPAPIIPMVNKRTMNLECMAPRLTRGRLGRKDKVWGCGRRDADVCRLAFDEGTVGAGCPPLLNVAASGRIIHIISDEC